MPEQEAVRLRVAEHAPAIAWRDMINATNRLWWLSIPWIVCGHPHVHSRRVRVWRALHTRHSRRSRRAAKRVAGYRA
jgi:hypothetical protein